MTLEVSLEDLFVGNFVEVGWLCWPASVVRLAQGCQVQACGQDCPWYQKVQLSVRNEDNPSWSWAFPGQWPLMVACKGLTWMPIRCLLSKCVRSVPMSSE